MTILLLMDIWVVPVGGARNKVSYASTLSYSGCIIRDGIAG